MRSAEERDRGTEPRDAGPSWPCSDRWSRRCWSVRARPPLRRRGEEVSSSECEVDSQISSRIAEGQGPELTGLAHGANGRSVEHVVPARRYDLCVANRPVALDHE